MPDFDELFFASSAWGEGNILLIDGYDFLITPVEVTGFCKTVSVRNSGQKLLSEVLLSDFKSGTSFVKNFTEKKSLINILNFELSVYDQPCLIYQKNYYGKIKEIDCNIKKNDENKYKILSEEKLIPGAIVFGKKSEFLGIVSKANNGNELIPAKYLLKVLEEFSKINKEAVRCLECGNIVRFENIYKETCPVCGAKIDKKILYHTLPQMDKTDIFIEETLQRLGYNLELSRLGRHYWEIEKGSATIFIRYNPETKFIAAFSPLKKLDDTKPETLKFLLSENKKLDYLYFSIADNYVYLNAPYLISDNFNSKILLYIFDKLFDLADYYDDII